MTALQGFLICCILAAILGATLFLAYALALAARPDDEFAAQRHPGLGDPATVPDNPWPVTNPATRQHARYAELAPERLEREWEEHCATTPGLADFDAWEAEQRAELHLLSDVADEFGVALGDAS